MSTVPRDANERRRRLATQRQWLHICLATLAVVSILMVFGLMVR